jgi:hypothetical protein
LMIIRNYLRNDYSTCSETQSKMLTKRKSEMWSFEKFSFLALSRSY